MTVTYKIMTAYVLHRGSSRLELWNTLPLTSVHRTSRRQFRSKLKTHLLRQAYITLHDSSENVVEECNSICNCNCNSSTKHARSRKCSKDRAKCWQGFSRLDEYSQLLAYQELRINSNLQPVCMVLSLYWCNVRIRLLANCNCQLRCAAKSLKHYTICREWHLFMPKLQLPIFPLPFLH